MLRMATVMLACFAVAVVGTIALDGRTARAEWSVYRADWDETAPVEKGLGDDGSLGDQMFHVEWPVTAAPDGQAETTGYVSSFELEPVGGA